MITLALDTSTARGSVALLRDADTLGEENFERARSADGLFEALAVLFRRTGIEPGAVELIGVGTGPGSFTGIRAGIAAARGLAFPGNTPIKGIASFDALALTALPDVPATANALCVLGDARRGEVYSAMYGRGGEALRGCAIATLDDTRRAAAGVGEAWFVSAENFPETTRVFPSASVIGRLARDRFLANGRRGDEQIEPLYLRATEYRKPGMV